MNRTITVIAALFLCAGCATTGKTPNYTYQTTSNQVVRNVEGVDSVYSMTDDSFITLSPRYEKLSGHQGSMFVVAAFNQSSQPLSFGPSDIRVTDAAGRSLQLLNSKRKASKQIHVVRSGDSFWSIPRKYGVPHKRLARWNGMAPGATLKIGQKRAVWSGKGKAANLSPRTAPPQTVSTVHYRVRRGDSLSRIARRFNVSIADLRKWNSLPGKYLQPGQRLKLYVNVTEQASL